MEDSGPTSPTHTSHTSHTSQNLPPMSPLDLLLPYQRAFVEDNSRWKLWLASRQIGKSFSAGCEVASDCLVNPGSTWLLVSAGQRQSLELCAKVRQWLQAFDLVIRSENLTDAQGEFLKAEITLKNGSRIIAVPANPDTVRGYSAHLVLDEFAFHRDAAELWSAVLPSITNPLRGELKVRILSTPNGQGGAGAMFYRLWSGDSSDVWSRHRTTIHDAAAGGLAVNIPEIRAGVADADTFRQEFECEFIDSARVAFPYDIISRCESPEASMREGRSENEEGRSENHPREARHSGAERPTSSSILHPSSLFYYVGIDIGSLHDPTVCLTLAAAGTRHIVKEVLILENMELADQVSILSPRIARAIRASIDASGIGLDIAQRLRRIHGGKLIAQPITAKWKRTAFQALQAALADARIALPADRRFRDDLHAYEVHGAGESATFRAPRTDEGHSDITSALVHALDAATAMGTGSFTSADAAASLAALRTAARSVLRPRFQPRKLA